MKILNKKSVQVIKRMMTVIIILMKLYLRKKIIIFDNEHANSESITVSLIKILPTDNVGPTCLGKEKEINKVAL